MKLAEALLERKSTKEQISDLEERLTRNVKVQEGDAPVEKPEELLVRINNLVDRLEKLIVLINRTNMRATMADGSTVMEAIAKRDMLKLRHGILEAAAEAAAITHNRFSRSEIKFQVTIDMELLQQEIDNVARAYRELDTAIQAVNWLTDCVEV